METNINYLQNIKIFRLFFIFLYLKKFSENCPEIISLICLVITQSIKVLWTRIIFIIR